MVNVVNVVTEVNVVRWKLRWCLVGWCRRTATWRLTWMVTHVKSGTFSNLYVKSGNFSRFFILIISHRSSVTRYTTYVLIIPVKILVFFISMVRKETFKTDINRYEPHAGPPSMVRQHHFSPFQPDRLLWGGTKLRMILICFFLSTAFIWQPHLQHHFSWFFGGEIWIWVKKKIFIWCWRATLTETALLQLWCLGSKLTSVMRYPILSFFFQAMIKSWNAQMYKCSNCMCSFFPL